MEQISWNSKTSTSTSGDARGSPACSCLAVADDGDHGVYTAVYPCRKGFHFRTLGLRATEHLLREQRSFSDPPSVVKCTAGTRGGQSKLCDPVTVVPRESIPTNSQKFHKMLTDCRITGKYTRLYHSAKTNIDRQVGGYLSHFMGNSKI